MENAGLYQKFEVRRRDGRDGPGGDREGAAYFTLDVVNDPHAVPALRAYAASCAADLPDLSRELSELADELAAGTVNGPAVAKLRIPR